MAECCAHRSQGRQLTMIWPRRKQAQCTLNSRFLVDGKVRSSRNLEDVALNDANFLKRLDPNSEVAVRDLQTGLLTRMETASTSAPARSNQVAPGHPVGFQKRGTYERTRSALNRADAEGTDP